MAVLEKGSPARRPSRSTLEWMNDERVRSVLYQLVVAAAVILVARYLFINTSEHLEARGLFCGLEFLGSTAGFSIAGLGLPYPAAAVQAEACWVGAAGAGTGRD